MTITLLSIYLFVGCCCLHDRFILLLIFVCCHLWCRAQHIMLAWLFWTCSKFSSPFCLHFIICHRPTVAALRSTYCPPTFYHLSAKKQPLFLTGSKLQEYYAQISCVPSFLWGLNIADKSSWNRTHPQRPGSTKTNICGFPLCVCVLFFFFFVFF